MTIGQGATAAVGAGIGAVLAIPTGGMSVAMGMFLGGSVGSTVGGTLFPPKGRTSGPAELQAQTSQYGIPIPVVYGTREITGNCIWYGNFKTIKVTQASGKGLTGGTPSAYYTYTVSVAFGLAINECMIIGVKASGRPLKDDAYYSGTFYNGNQTTPDPHIQAILTAQGITRFPVWKGLAYVVYQDFNLGTVTSVPILTHTLKSTSVLPHEDIFVSKFGSSGSGQGQFATNTGIAVDSNYIYTTEESNHRVQIFNKVTNAFVATFGTLGSGDAQLNTPIGIAVDSNYIYICDSGNNRVQIFNKVTYAPYSRFGTAGTGDGQFNIPYGIALDSTYLYVTDYANRRVQIFTKSTLAYFNKFGSAGTADGLFTQTAGIAVDSTYIYVSDYGGARGQFFSLAAPYTFSGKALSATEFVGVAVDSDYVYFTEFPAHRVNAYNHHLFRGVVSVFEFSIGTYGSGDSNFYFPGAVAVDSNFVYISDTGNSRIKVYNRDMHILQFPNDIVKNALLNTFYGLGLPSSYVDNPSFMAVKAYNRADDVKLSFTANKQLNILDFFQYILMHHNGLIRYAGGKFQYKQLSEFMTALTSITESSFVKGKGVPFFSVIDKGASEYFNKVTVQYTKPFDVIGSTSSIDRTDIDKNGLKDTVINLDGLSTYSAANKMAQRLLNKSMSNPKSVSVKLGISKYSIFTAGDQINLSDTLTQFNSLVTVTSISIDDNYNIKLDAVEEIIQNYDVIVIGSDTSSPPPPADLASPVSSVTSIVADELPAQYTTTNKYFITFSAPSQVQWTRTGLYKSYVSGSGYSSKKNTINSGVTGVVTEIGVTGDIPYIKVTLDTNFILESATDIDTLMITPGLNLGGIKTSGGQTIFIRYEDVELISGNIWKLSNLIYDVGGEAQLNTYGTIIVGDTFYLVGELAYVGDIINSEIGKTLYFKIASVNLAGDEQPLGNCIAVPLLIKGRALTPLAPVNITVNGIGITSSNVITISAGDITFNWISRNRHFLGMTDFNRTDTSKDNLDFENFSLEIYNGANSVLLREVSQTGKSFIYTSAMQTTDGNPNSILFKIKQKNFNYISDYSSTITVTLI